MNFCISHFRFLLSSVQFSCSVVSDSLWPHEPQHARPPCPSPTPRVYSNPCPSNRWCHPAISSSVVPFSSCPQSLPASGSFPTSQLFTWGGQSTGVLASAPVLPGLTSFRMDWLDLLAVQGTLKSLLQHRSSKASTFQLSAFFFSSVTCKSLGFGLQLPCLKKFFYITFLFLFINFFWLQSSIWELSSPSRDGTGAPCIGSAES